MKNITLILYAALFVTWNQAYAVDFAMEGSLSHQLQLSWNKVSKFRHSLDCYPGGKGDERDDLGGETITTAQGLDLFTNKVLGIASTRVGIGRVDYNLSVIKTAEYDEAVFSLTDAVRWSSYSNIGDSDCVIREYHWKVSSHRIKGDYKINVKVPQKAWLISLSIPKHEGQIAKSIGAIQGDLHGLRIDPNETLLWVKPGSTISIPISVDGYATGGSFGEIRIRVKNLISELRGYENDGNSRLLKIREKLVASRDSASREIAAKEFLEIGHQLLQNSAAATLTTQTFSMEKNTEMFQWLFEVANDPSVRYGKYTQHVKVMAAAVGYQLSLSLLNDLMVFCKEIEVQLPLTGKTIKSSGLKAAYFWVNKDLKRLENLRFPEIRAFVEELIRWQNLNLKYSDIANNKVEFKKLDEGYVKIRRFSEIGLDVFGDIKYGLGKTMKNFGSVGSNLILAEQIKSQLDVLANQRRNLNKDLTKQVGDFNYSNHAYIKAADLLTNLNLLEADTQKLALDLKEKTKFVAVDGDASSATAIMTSLLGNQVAIFEKPLTSKFAEPVRLLFFRWNQIKKFHNSLNRV